MGHVRSAAALAAYYRSDLFDEVSGLDAAFDRARRRLRRECTRYGYNLSGNTTGVCSECGQAFEGE